MDFYFLPEVGFDLDCHHLQRKAFSFMMTIMVMTIMAVTLIMVMTMIMKMSWMILMMVMMMSDSDLYSLHHLQRKHLH